MAVPEQGLATGPLFISKELPYGINHSPLIPVRECRVERQAQALTEESLSDGEISVLTPKLALIECEQMRGDIVDLAIDAIVS